MASLVTRPELLTDQSENEDVVDQPSLLSFYGGYVKINRSDKAKAYESKIVKDLQRKLTNIQSNKDFTANDYKQISDQLSDLRK